MADGRRHTRLVSARSLEVPSITVGASPENMKDPEMTDKIRRGLIIER